MNSALRIISGGNAQHRDNAHVIRRDVREVPPSFFVGSPFQLGQDLGVYQIPKLGEMMCLHLDMCDLPSESDCDVIFESAVDSLGLD
jgi:hypothetical protein